MPPPPLQFGTATWLSADSGHIKGNDVNDFQMVASKGGRLLSSSPSSFPKAGTQTWSLVLEQLTHKMEAEFWGQQYAEMKGAQCPPPPQNHHTALDCDVREINR